VISTTRIAPVGSVLPSRASATFHAADRLEALLQAERVETADRQCREGRDALVQHAVGVLEGERDLGLRPGRLGGIGHTPVGGHRLAGPHRAALAGRVVADREDEIERRRARQGELLPRFRAQDGGVVAEAVEQRERVRIDRAFGLAAGREGAKLAGAELFENGLGEDRPR
jgi:hypothetical protein